MASKADTIAIQADEEAAAAKLWAVYVSEAEKYDRGLVESWKGDMEGLLIFAALFSSILTAFIIESYKSLNADSGDLTVQLLAQISHQLAASANGSAFDVPSPTPFSPAASSVICNVLWFISLGFSLACALIATFVQQWSRDFLHKTDMRSAPAIRARIFSYLYFGLKRFQMHSVVEIIPLLLHGSLILFFCGLVAFLIPVNIAMTVVAAAVLAIVAAVYSALTFLPLWYLDCPYRTPLSGAFWRAFRGRFWNRQNAKTDADVEPGSSAKPVVESQPSQVEAMSRMALETRSDRDCKAPIWTVKSLADDIELEPLVEALPDVLWGPTYRRHTYEAHIRGLIHHPDVQLLMRINSLLDSCDHGILSSDSSVRRRITCYKAVWAIASLSAANTSRGGCCGTSQDECSRTSQDESTTPALDLTYMHLRPLSTDADPRLVTYWIPAKAMWLWNTFCLAKGRLIELQKHLRACEAAPDMQERDRTREMEQISASFSEIQQSFYMLPLAWEPGTAPHCGPKLQSLIDASLTEIPFLIILEFLSQSTLLDSPPYQWQGKHITIQVSQTVPSSLKAPVENLLRDVIATQLPGLKAEANETKTPWILHIIRRALSLWRPLDPDSIPPSIIDLLNWQGSTRSRHQLQHIFDNHDVQKSLWDCFPRTLFVLKMREQAFTALWRLASFDHHPYPREYLALQRGGVVPHARTLVSIESLLDCLLITQTPFHAVTRSIIALLKVQVLVEQLVMHNFSEWEEDVVFEHHLFPTETAIPISDGAYSDRGRVTEAVLVVVTEYLEHCTTEALPYKAAETLLRMTRTGSRPLTAIHPTHQIRFATAICGIYSGGPCGESDSVQELQEEILDCELWELYAEGPKTEQQVKERLASDYSDESWPWLDNIEAHQKVREALSNYEREVSTNYKREVSITLLYQARVRAILQGLDCWHPDPDNVHLTNYEGDSSRLDDKGVGEETGEK
ncbi:hypothetical protein DFH06DRAFT_1484640 [Mycena polygramma]|nr:hypothetical protein DFH06DRAFT_1484640 [Mycena polygramma]